MILSPRVAVYRLLVDSSRAPRSAKVYDALMIGFILLSTAAIIAESVPVLHDRHLALFTAFEYLTVAILSAEFIGRFWVCTDDPYYGDYGPIRGRWKYLSHPMMLVDLGALLPFYLAMLTTVDLRILLVLRLLRVLKVARYSPALASVLNAVVAERKSLWASLQLILVALIMISGMMYHLEGTVQPEAFGTIPKAMWWAIVTITTVGYGDVTPITPEGRVLAGISALVGIMVCAVPAGIMASSFIEEVRKRNFVVNCQLVVKVPSFRALPAPEVAEIASVLQPMEVDANEVIIHRGAAAERIFFLVDGTAKIDLPDNPIYLQKGEFFGEHALLFNQPRQATIISITDCKLLYLDREPFLDLLNAHPHIRRTIEKVALKRFGHRPTGLT